MGEMLKQKNLEVTDYYSQPTGSMVASAADTLLARFAAQLDVGDAVTHTPNEVRQLYEEARGKVGALAEVIGGHCVQPGFCPAKFACIGCPANARRSHTSRADRTACCLAQRTEGGRHAARPAFGGGQLGAPAS
jgi:hypothetical protein